MVQLPETAHPEWDDDDSFEEVQREPEQEPPAPDTASEEGELVDKLNSVNMEGGDHPPPPQDDPKPKGKNSIYRAKVSLEELYHGTTLELKIERTKRVWEKTAVPCKPCGSRGFVMETRQDPTTGDLVPTEKKCVRCHGEGCQNQGPQWQVKTVTEDVSVDIRPGMRNGQSITVAGMGDENLDTSAGDLQIVLEETTHPIFKRKNENDLVATKEVSHEEAMNGLERKLTLLDQSEVVVKAEAKDIVSKSTCVTEPSCCPQTEPIIVETVETALEILHPSKKVVKADAEDFFRHELTDHMVWRSDVQPSSNIIPPKPAPYNQGGGHSIRRVADAGMPSLESPSQKGNLEVLFNVQAPKAEEEASKPSSMFGAIKSLVVGIRSTAVDKGLGMLALGVSAKSALYSLFGDESLSQCNDFERTENPNVIVSPSFGGSGGGACDHGCKQPRLEKIVVYDDGHVVRAIDVYYHGKPMMSIGQFTKGASSSTLELGEDEYICFIKVRSNRYVQELTFGTNRGNTLGPCGGTGWRPILGKDTIGYETLVLGDPSLRLCGFRGTVGRRLDSIAFYLENMVAA